MLHHVRAGAGEPLVMLHGLGSEHRMWTPVLDALAARRDVVAVDLPGHGASAPLDVRPSIPALADSVCELFAALGLERPHVAGNSLGGGIALELARTGRARSATGLSPIGFMRGREVAWAVRSLAASRVLARALDPLAPALLATAAGRTLLQSQYYARPWRVPADEALRATRNLGAATGFAATLPEVGAFRWDHGDLDVPVTIAWGPRDRLLIARQARRARRLMPRADHVWLDGCGHVPTWDDPTRVAAVILAGSRGT